MRIRHIISQSAKLPIKEFKIFIIIFLLNTACIMISKNFFEIDVGQWSVATMIISTAVSLILIGIMMNMTYYVVYDKQFELNIKESFIEGTKEYLVTMHYIILSVLLSSLFIVPTGVYARLMHIHEYIINMDINTTFMTIHEISGEIPVNLQINLQHSIQLNFLISLIIFLFLSSFGFIGKTLLFRTKLLTEILFC